MHLTGLHCFGLGLLYSGNPLLCTGGGKCRTGIDAATSSCFGMEAYLRNGLQQPGRDICPSSQRQLRCPELQRPPQHTELQQPSLLVKDQSWEYMAVRPLARVAGCCAQQKAKNFG